MTPDSYHALIRGELRGPWPMLLRSALRMIGIPYGGVMWLRNQLYSSGWWHATHVERPVICVGNLTLGGTGKTPCVEYVARHFADQGHAVAILSRGYGHTGGRNDEAMILEDNLPDVPHLQGRDRVSLAQTAIEELESDVLILDDGFQHRRLHRDLDIVLVDAIRPLAREWIFPGGLLREGVSGLRRAGVILLTRCDAAGPENVRQQQEWLNRRCPGTPVYRTEHCPIAWIGEQGHDEPLEHPETRNVIAFAGIGNPQGFHATLRNLGYTILEARNFPDHHNYTREDILSLQQWAEKFPGPVFVATTQKDWVKLRIDRLGEVPLKALKIGFRILDQEEEFIQQLDAVMTN